MVVRTSKKGSLEKEKGMNEVQWSLEVRVSGVGKVMQGKEKKRKSDTEKRKLHRTKKYSGGRKSPGHYQGGDDLRGLCIGRGKPILKSRKRTEPP